MQLLDGDLLTNFKMFNYEVPLPEQLHQLNRKLDPSIKNELVKASKELDSYERLYRTLDGNKSIKKTSTSHNYAFPIKPGTLSYVILNGAYGVKPQLLLVLSKRFGLIFREGQYYSQIIELPYTVSVTEVATIRSEIPKSELEDLFYEPSHTKRQNWLNKVLYEYDFI